MKLIDTHCHLNFNNFTEDLSEVINRSVESGVKGILVPGIDFFTSQQAISLAEAYPIIFAAVGFHPNNLDEWENCLVGKLIALASHPKVVAIGEIGLDYYRDKSPSEVQKKAFIEQLRIAQEIEKPVIIHNRNAEDDILKTLQSWQRTIPPKNRLQSKPGVFHSFDGTLEMANQAIEMNFFLGLNGPVTFKNAKEKRMIVKQIPLNSILLETDAPFLTPHPYRGRRNEPMYLRLIAQTIADCHEISMDEVVQRTTQNAENLFFRESND